MEIINNKSNLFMSLFVLAISTISVNAQKLGVTQSTVTVNGTSTLHSWDMTSKEAAFTGTVNGNKIDNVVFTIKATSLKSKDSSLDKNAYKALDTSKYPDITFNAVSIPASGTSNVSGKLTIANSTKEISLPVTVAKNGATYTLSGKVKLKMTTFGIKPPSVMMGTIKSGDEITISYNVSAK